MTRSFKDIFLIVFPLTALLFGGMTYYLLNLKTLGSHGLWMAVGLGFGCGAVFGTGIGYFVRSFEFDFDIDPSVDIDTRLQLLMLEMGYRLEDRMKKVVIFSPTLRAGILADRIRVELMPGHVKIGGPVYHLEQIRKKLGV
ncbi:MAG: hypothetical protein HY053_01350 [Proteobacteria bacterium]|nr:hypothetical protein [Pseudomonadota bacterium]